MASVNVNKTDLDAIIDRASFSKTARIKEVLLDELRRRAPRVTGALADSIRVEIDKSTNHLSIKVRIYYAEAVIKGANPHVIEGTPLVFNWAKRGGMKVFTFHVNHPGNKPNDQWIKDAVAETIRLTK